MLSVYYYQFIMYKYTKLRKLASVALIGLRKLLGNKTKRSLKSTYSYSEFSVKKKNVYLKTPTLILLPENTT